MKNKTGNSFKLFVIIAAIAVIGLFASCDGEICVEHDVPVWTVTKEATLTTAGERVGVCILCDETVFEVIPMQVIPTELVGKWTTTTARTIEVTVADRIFKVEDSPHAVTFEIEKWSLETNGWTTDNDRNGSFTPTLKTNYPNGYKLDGIVKDRKGGGFLIDNRYVTNKVGDYHIGVYFNSNKSKLIMRWGPHIKDSCNHANCTSPDCIDLVYFYHHLEYSK